MATALSTTQGFAPPGKGAWELDQTHFPRALPRINADLLPGTFCRGFAEGTKLHGLLLDYLDYRSIDGFMYSQPRVVGAPPGAKTPPKFILRLLLALHPKMRERVAISRRLQEERPWRKDYDLWEAETKPAHVRAHLALQAIDPAALDDAGLAKYIAACHEHLGRMLYWHGRLTISAFLPSGDLIAACTEWADVPPGKVLQALRGSSPISAGDSPELRALAAALRTSQAGRALLQSNDTPEVVLTRLGNEPGAIGETARRYFELFGYRVISGYDIGEPYGLEVPQILLEGIRHAAGDEKTARRAEADAAVLASVRDAIPAAHHNEFDRLLAEARTMSPLRDERVLYCDVWASGILRRALLEAGRRLVAGGRLEQPRHAVEASFEEIQSLLAGGTTPGATELAERARRRATAQAPATLGGEPGAPPPPEWLPLPLRWGQRTTFAVINSLFGVSAAKHEERRLTGIPVSGGIYEGPARVVNDPRDLDRIRRGDVLIARSTSPAYNMILPLLGAIVTDRGGALCHAAIVTREFGIPGVVGTREATQRIETGARVRVNGNDGTVSLL